MYSNTTQTFHSKENIFGTVPFGQLEVDKLSTDDIRGNFYLFKKLSSNLEERISLFSHWLNKDEFGLVQYLFTQWQENGVSFNEALDNNAVYSTDHISKRMLIDGTSNSRENIDYHLFSIVVVELFTYDQLLRFKDTLEACSLEQNKNASAELDLLPDNKVNEQSEVTIFNYEQHFIDIVDADFEEEKKQFQQALEEQKQRQQQQKQRQQQESSENLNTTGKIQTPKPFIQTPLPKKTSFASRFFTMDNAKEILACTLLLGGVGFVGGFIVGAIIGCSIGFFAMTAHKALQAIAEPEVVVVSESKGDEKPRQSSFAVITSISHEGSGQAPQFNPETDGAETRSANDDFRPRVGKTPPINIPLRNNHELEPAVNWVGSYSR